MMLRIVTRSQPDFSQERELRLGHLGWPVQASPSDRTENDRGGPYEFKDAETLIDDFFDEVERVLRERGIGVRVVAEESRGERRAPSGSSTPGFNF